MWEEVCSKAVDSVLKQILFLNDRSRVCLAEQAISKNQLLIFETLLP